jgi:hypothetical protein
MRRTRLWVEQGFQPCISYVLLRDGFQPLRYAMPPQAQSTAGAEALMFLARSCRPEGLPHPIMNNAAYRVSRITVFR